MNETEPKAAGETGLQCLGGAEPTADITLGVKDLMAFPEAAKQRFWEALGPLIQFPLPKDLDSLLDAFRRTHEVPAKRFARAVTACRALLVGAGRNGVEAEDFQADLDCLADSDGELAAILMPGFDRAIAAIKQEILYSSLTDHGKLLIGVDWRVDTMAQSSRGRQLNSPVAQITLRYREGQEERRLTLQALPDLLMALQRMCAQIVG